jgi:hypothetical protein
MPIRHPSLTAQILNLPGVSPEAPAALLLISKLTSPTNKFVGLFRLQRPLLPSRVLRSLRQRFTSAQPSGEENSNALVPDVQGGIQIAIQQLCAPGALPLTVAQSQLVVDSAAAIAGLLDG